MKPSKPLTSKLKKLVVAQRTGAPAISEAANPASAYSGGMYLHNAAVSGSSKEYDRWLKIASEYSAINPDITPALENLSALVSKRLSGANNQDEIRAAFKPIDKILGDIESAHFENIRKAQPKKPEPGTKLDANQFLKFYVFPSDLIGMAGEDIKDGHDMHSVLDSLMDNIKDDLVSQADITVENWNEIKGTVYTNIKKNLGRLISESKVKPNINHAMKLIDDMENFVKSPKFSKTNMENMASGFIAKLGHKSKVSKLTGLLIDIVDMADQVHHKDADPQNIKTLFDDLRTMVASNKTVISEAAKFDWDNFFYVRAYKPGTPTEFPSGERFAKSYYVTYDSTFDAALKAFKETGSPERGADAAIKVMIDSGLDKNASNWEKIKPEVHDFIKKNLIKAYPKLIKASNNENVNEEGMWYGEQDSESSDSNIISEAVKKGKKVKLNKPFRTPGGPKKFSVYVKNDKGNVVKVNFGDPNMEIKRDDPKRRKNFRARHGCDKNPGPKWKAKYWSCRFWAPGQSVTQLTESDVTVSTKTIIAESMNTSMNKITTGFAVITAGMKPGKTYAHPQGFIFSESKQPGMVAVKAQGIKDGRASKIQVIAEATGPVLIEYTPNSFISRFVVFSDELKAGYEEMRKSGDWSKALDVVMTGLEANSKAMNAVGPETWSRIKKSVRAQIFRQMNRAGSPAVNVDDAVDAKKLGEARRLAPVFESTKVKGFAVIAEGMKPGKVYTHTKGFIFSESMKPGMVAVIAQTIADGRAKRVQIVSETPMVPIIKDRKPTKAKSVPAKEDLTNMDHELIAKVEKLGGKVSKAKLERLADEVYGSTVGYTPDAETIAKFIAKHKNLIMSNDAMSQIKSIHNFWIGGKLSDADAMQQISEILE